MHCDSYITHASLAPVKKAVHLEKFGVPMPLPDHAGASAAEDDPAAGAATAADADLSNSEAQTGLVYDKAMTQHIIAAGCACAKKGKKGGSSAHWP